MCDDCGCRDAEEVVYPEVTVYQSAEQIPSFSNIAHRAESKFDKLSDKIAKQYRKKGMSAKEAKEIGNKTAYTIGRKKYGKAGMAKKARAGMRAESFEAFDKDGNVIMDEAYYNWSQPCDMCDGGTLRQEGDENDLWVVIWCDSCDFSQQIKMKEAESFEAEDVEGMKDIWWAYKIDDEDWKDYTRYKRKHKNFDWSEKVMFVEWVHEKSWENDEDIRYHLRFFENPKSAQKFIGRTKVIYDDEGEPEDMEFIRVYGKVNNEDLDYALTFPREGVFNPYIQYPLLLGGNIASEMDKRAAESFGADGDIHYVVETIKNNKVISKSKHFNNSKDALKLFKEKTSNKSKDEEIQVMEYRDYGKADNEKGNLFGESIYADEQGVYGAESFEAEVRGHTLYPHNDCEVCGENFNKLIICDGCAYQVCDADAKDNMVEFDGSKKGLRKKAHYCKECNSKNAESFEAQGNPDKRTTTQYANFYVGWEDEEGELRGGGKFKKFNDAKAQAEIVAERNGNSRVVEKRGFALWTDDGKGMWQEGYDKADAKKFYSAEDDISIAQGWRLGLGMGLGLMTLSALTTLVAFGLTKRDEGQE